MILNDKNKYICVNFKCYFKVESCGGLLFAKHSTVLIPPPPKISVSFVQFKDKFIEETIDR
jgi:hypothetical protein